MKTLPALLFAAATWAAVPLAAWCASSDRWTRHGLMERAYSRSDGASSLVERAAAAMKAASAADDQQGFVNASRMMAVAAMTSSTTDLSVHAGELSTALRIAQALEDWEASSEIHLASAFNTLNPSITTTEEDAALHKAEADASRAGSGQLSMVYFAKSLHEQLKRPDLAASYAVQAYDVATNPFDRAKALSQIAQSSLMRAQQNTPDAYRPTLQRLREALELAPPEQYPDFSLARLLKLADVLRVSGDLESAAAEMKRAHKLAIETKQWTLAKATMQSLAKVDLARKRPLDALESLAAADAIPARVANDFGVAMLTRAQALVMLEPPRTAEAIAALAAAKAALPTNPSYSARYQLIYLRIADVVYASTGQYKLAYENFKEVDRAQLKEIAEANVKASTEAEAKFDLARKEEENRRLIAEQEKARANRNALIVALGSAALLSIGLGYFLWARNRQRNALANLSAALSDSNAKLAEFNENRSKLLVAACHDLRQPAHSLGMLAEVASLNNDADEVAAQLRSIKRCSTMLSNMLSELLDLSLLEQGNYVVHSRPVPLQPVLDELRAQFETAVAAKGMTFHVDSTDAVVRSDPNLLQRTLLNLLSNALKYSDQGSISLEVTEDDTQRVTLTVRDTGIGMAPEQLDRAFEDYERLPGTRDRGGLGIGLAVVRRAASALGHALDVTSSPDDGTAVRLVVQRIQDTAAAVSSTPPPVSNASGHLRVALIENDDEARNGATRLLQAWGHDVVAYASCAQAEHGLLSTAHGSEVDMIISDHHLADGEGLSLIVNVRQRLERPQLAALLMTGDLNREVFERCQTLGIELLYKPIIPTRLREAILGAAAASPAASPARVTALEQA